ncbi:MAG: DUF3179 domain-containing protein, partial [Chloroflexota bacterium]
MADSDRYALKGAKSEEPANVVRSQRRSAGSYPPSRVVSGLVILLVVVLTAGALLLPRLSRPDHTRDQPVLVPPPPEVDPALIDDLLPRGIIEAIDDPQFQTVDEVDPDMEPDERLIGVSINGDVRAYPINILSSHEIVNDIVGGEPIAVTWCPLCFSALVFSRHLQGHDEPLTFGVTG